MPTMPTLHLNGSGFDNLMEGYRAVYDSLTTFLKTLQEYGPNQRDYYVMPGSWEKAAKEHDDRIEKIQSVRKEILAIVIDIQKQKDGRGR